MCRYGFMYPMPHTETDPPWLEPNMIRRRSVLNGMKRINQFFESGITNTVISILLPLGLSLFGSCH